MQKKTILILGGYGVFGQKIAAKLSRESHLEIIIAGRDMAAATTCAHSLSAKAAHIIIPDTLDQKLSEIQPDLVINCCGPFQHMDYTTPESCIRHKAHYIDLADGRDYVVGFKILHDLAVENNVTVITGVSTVPAISSAVLDHFLQTDFSEINVIDYGITPGNQTLRGIATVAGILSYVGKPFTTLINGKMKSVYGWQDLHRQSYPVLNKRWMSNCDIPDLGLFKDYYPSLQTIRFYAGLELSFLHLAVWVLSWLSRFKIIGNYKKYAAALRKMSLWFYRFGTTHGGMHMSLLGKDKSGHTIHKKWYIIAKDGDGPQIPSTPAVILAKMFANEDITKIGAFPCISFITLDQVMNELKEFSISTRIL